MNLQKNNNLIKITRIETFICLKSNNATLKFYSKTQNQYKLLRTLHIAPFSQILMGTT